MTGHEWGKIGRFEVCKVCCRLRPNVESKPCRGPSPMREPEGTVALPWTQAQAIELCTLIETVAPQYGCHVALTGGLLYKAGERKDADILLYRIRQVEEIDVEGLMLALQQFGVEPGEDFGWCFKAKYEGRDIDFFFPERTDGGDYPPRREPDPDAALEARRDDEMAEPF